MYMNYISINLGKKVSCSDPCERGKWPEHAQLVGMERIEHF